MNLRVGLYDVKNHDWKEEYLKNKDFPPSQAFLYPHSSEVICPQY